MKNLITIIFLVLSFNWFSQEIEIKSTELDKVEPGELSAYIFKDLLIVSCKNDNASQILHKGVGDRIILLKWFYIFTS